ncbi:C40 family peptidase [Terrisporobacter sp.]
MSINKKYALAGMLVSSIMLHTNMDTVFANTEYRVITGNAVNFRSGAGTNYSSLGKLNKGDKVEYLGESGSWVKIKYNGQTGYVYGSYVEKNKSTTVKYVSATKLNIRSGAGESYSKLGSLNKGSRVEVISTTNGWSKINYSGSTAYVSSKYLSKSLVEASKTTKVSASKVISYAKKLLGKPYVWGAEGPSSFDCSGFTYYVFKNTANISLPRVSKDQSNFGTYVKKSNLKEGDLIFFDTNGGNNGNVSHVGIYLGDNKFIHSSSSKGKVVISEMSSYYTKAFVNARRVL